MAVRRDNIQIVVDIEAQQGVRAYQKLLDQTREVNNEMRRLKRQGKENSDEFKALQKRAEELGAELKNLGGAGANFAQLITRSRDLNRELKSLVPGTKRFIDVTGELKLVNTRIREIRDESKGVTKSLDEMRIVGVKIPPMIAKIGTTFAALGIANILQSAVGWLFRTATEIETLGKKTTTVFGQAEKVVDQYAAANAAAMGLTTREYKNAATAAGDLLIPMQFNRETAAELSGEIVNLGGALAEWSGGQYTASETTNILTKALLGEREELKSLGIAISEADVQNRLAEKGMKGLTGAAGEQAKALVTLELIVEKSADAQTNFSNSSDSLLKSQNRLQSAFTRIQEGLAQRLIPAFASLVGKVADLIAPTESAEDATRRLQDQFNLEIEVLKAGNITQDERNKLIGDINQKYGEYLPNLITEKTSIENIEKAQRAANQVFEQKILYMAFEEDLAKLLKESAKAAKEAAGAERARVAVLQETEKLKDLPASVQDLANSQVEFFETTRDANLEFVKNSQQRNEELKKSYDDLAKQAGFSFDEILKRFSQFRSSGVKDVIATAEKQIEVVRKLGEEVKIADEKIKPIVIKEENVTSFIDETQFATDEDLLKNKFLRALVTEQEYEEQRYQLQQESFSRRLNQLRQQFGEESQQFVQLENEKLEAQRDYEQQRAELTKRTEQARLELLQSGLGATSDFVGGIIDLLKAEQGERKKNSLALKAFSAGKVIIDTEEAIMAIIKNAQANPANILFPGAGNIISGIKIAAVLARSTAALSKIGSTNFYGGGYTGSQPFIKDNQGRGIVGGVHANEWVGPEWMNRHPVYGQVISWLENMRQRGYQDGGFTTVNTTPSIPAAAAAPPPAAGFDVQAIMQQILQSNERVVRAIERKQFAVNTGQLRDALEEDYRLDEKAGF